MQKEIMLMSIIMGLGWPIYAAVTPLEMAFNAGKVCEKVDGFIQSTPGNESETSDLVASVNANRASVYADIAKKQDTDPVTVGSVSAKELRIRPDHVSNHMHLRICLTY